MQVRLCRRYTQIWKLVLDRSNHSGWNPKSSKKVAGKRNIYKLTRPYPMSARHRRVEGEKAEHGRSLAISEICEKVARAFLVATDVLFLFYRSKEPNLMK